MCGTVSAIGYIGQEDITPLGFLIPFKHGIDRPLDLLRAAFVNAAGIDPKVCQSILLSLLASEFQLLVTPRFILSRPFSYVTEEDLFVMVLTPYM